MQNTAQSAAPQKAPARRVMKPRPKPPIPTEYQTGAVDGLGEPELIKLLQNPEGTVFQKAKACQRLAHKGTAAAVPALAALLDHPQLGHYARYGLEPMPGPAADEALRAALPRLKGPQLVGAINTIGFRKDAQAVGALAKLLRGSDPEVAKAAAAALGSISGAQAAKALLDALAQTKGALRTAVAAGGVVCAEGLLAKGERGQAFDLYNRLAGEDIPKPVRLAAMHGVIAAEVSLSRPR